jgi:hypothetical protein
MTFAQLQKMEEISIAIENMVTKENETQIMQTIIVAIGTKQITQKYFKFLVKKWVIKTTENKKNN